MARAAGAPQRAPSCSAVCPAARPSHALSTPSDKQTRLLLRCTQTEAPSHSESYSRFRSQASQLTWPTTRPTNSEHRQLTLPTTRPTKPTNQLTLPTTRPTKPTNQLTLPTTCPTKPTNRLTLPTTRPTKPTNRLTLPTTRPTKRKKSRWLVPRASSFWMIELGLGYGKGGGGRAGA